MVTRLGNYIQSLANFSHSDLANPEPYSYFQRLIKADWCKPFSVARSVCKLKASRRIVQLALHRIYSGLGDFVSGHNNIVNPWPFMRFCREKLCSIQ